MDDVLQGAPPHIQTLREDARENGFHFHCYSESDYSGRRPETAIVEEHGYLPAPEDNTLLIPSFYRARHGRTQFNEAFRVTDDIAAMSNVKYMIEYGAFCAHNCSTVGPLIHTVRDLGGYLIQKDVSDLDLVKHLRGMNSLLQALGIANQSYQGIAHGLWYKMDPTRSPFTSIKIVRLLHLDGVFDCPFVYNGVRFDGVVLLNFQAFRLAAEFGPVNEGRSWNCFQTIILGSMGVHANQGHVFGLKIYTHNPQFQGCAVEIGIGANVPDNIPYVLQCLERSTLLVVVPREEIQALNVQQDLFCRAVPQVIRAMFQRPINAELRLGPVRLEDLAQMRNRISMKDNLRCAVRMISEYYNRAVLLGDAEGMPLRRGVHLDGVTAYLSAMGNLMGYNTLETRTPRAVGFMIMAIPDTDIPWSCLRDLVGISVQERRFLTDTLWITLQRAWNRLYEGNGNGAINCHHHLRRLNKTVHEFA